jgi:putative ABC transport system substrate-binding protein
VTAFVQALQQLGWSVGQNIRLHYRWGDGTSATMQKYAAEMVALAPDLILADSRSRQLSRRFVELTIDLRQLR